MFLRPFFLVCLLTGYVSASAIAAREPKSSESEEFGGPATFLSTLVTVAKAQCKEHANIQAYEHMVSEFVDFTICIMEIAEDVDDSDESKDSEEIVAALKDPFFIYRAHSVICKNANKFSKCFSSLLDAVQPCIDPKEKEAKPTVVKIVDNYAKYTCSDESLQFLNVTTAILLEAKKSEENGPFDCLKEKYESLLKCHQPTADNEVDNDDSDDEDDFSKYFKRDCSAFENVYTCVEKEVKTCPNPLTVQFADKVIEAARVIIPCNKE